MGTQVEGVLNLKSAYYVSRYCCGWKPGGSGLTRPIMLPHEAIEPIGERMLLIISNKVASAGEFPKQIRIVPLLVFLFPGKPVYVSYYSSDQVIHSRRTEHQ